MSECMKSPADRQFRRRCQIAGCSSLVLYLACSQLALHMHEGPGGFVLAGIAGAAFVAELISVAFLVVRIRDEFQRILLTRSFVWATVITVTFATIWGFLELHSHDTIPHLPTLAIPFLLIFLTALAKVVIFRQHKSPQE